MPYHDIQQILSAGAHTIGGGVNLWTQSSLTRSYWGIRDVAGGISETLLNPLHLSRCEHGVIHARGGEEQQGAGDGGQTDSLHWLIDTRGNGPQPHTDPPLVLLINCKVSPSVKIINYQVFKTSLLLHLAQEVQLK